MHSRRNTNKRSIDGKALPSTAFFSSGQVFSIDAVDVEITTLQSGVVWAYLLWALVVSTVHPYKEAFFDRGSP